MTPPDLKAIELLLDDAVLTVRLNRPDKSNALDDRLWQEIRSVFQWAAQHPGVRVVLLAGAGRHFCAGIDLAMLGGIMSRIADADDARSRENLYALIRDLQDCLSSIERCRKPVLVAVHGACLGGGLDMAACCDMRYASADAVFAIREIDLGMVADVGSLQRLPHLMPPGLVRELAYTGRDLDADEARQSGLVNAVFPDAEALFAGVMRIARRIAGKSPLAVRGTKSALNFARDHSVADGLEQVANWNAATLLSADLREAVAAAREKRTPRFND